jgi:hypothetical protein
MAGKLITGKQFYVVLYNVYILVWNFDMDKEKVKW